MSLQSEIDYYETRQAEFERDNNLEWVIIRDRKVIGFYKDFQRAADRYEHEYDGRPMLLRRIGYTPTLQKFEFATVDAP